MATAELTVEVPPEGAGRNKTFYTPLLTLYTWVFGKMVGETTNNRKYQWDDRVIKECERVVKTAVETMRRDKLTIKTAKSIESAMGEVLRAGSTKGGYDPRRLIDI